MYRIIKYVGMYKRESTKRKKMEFMSEKYFKKRELIQNERVAVLFIIFYNDE